MRPNQKVLSKGRKPFEVEKCIQLVVQNEKRGYRVTTQGLEQFDKPELEIDVADGIYLGTACSILNDAARHFVEKNVQPKNGYALQIGSHVAVRFEGRKSPLKVRDASELLESLSAS